MSTPTVIGIQALVYTTTPLATSPTGHSTQPHPTVNQPPTAGSSLSSINDSIEQAMAKRFAEMEALIQKIPRVPAPIKKSLPHSYADSPFVDFIALIEMPRKFSFPNMKMYDGTTDPTDHIASYKQRMFTAAIRGNNARHACARASAPASKAQPSSGTPT